MRQSQPALRLEVRKLFEDVEPLSGSPLVTYAWQPAASTGDPGLFSRIDHFFVLSAHMSKCFRVKEDGGLQSQALARRIFDCVQLVAIDLFHTNVFDLRIPLLKREQRP